MLPEPGLVVREALGFVGTQDFLQSPAFLDRLAVAPVVEDQADDISKDDQAHPDRERPRTVLRKVKREHGKTQRESPGGNPERALLPDLLGLQDDPLQPQVLFLVDRRAPRLGCFRLALLRSRCFLSAAHGRYALVSFKQISCIYFLRDVVQGGIIAIGDDGGGAGLEGGEVVHDLGAEEGGAVREGGFIDDHGGALGLDALHDALDGGLAEVVGVGLHRQAKDADHAGVLARGVELSGGVVVVVAGLAKDLVSDEVLAGAVRLHDGLDQLLRHVVEVREELLGVLREAVAAVAEGGVVVVRADAGVQAHALDDRARVEALHLRIRIQLVEIAHS